MAVSGAPKTTLGSFEVTIGAVALALPRAGDRLDGNRPVMISWSPGSGTFRISRSTNGVAWTQIAEVTDVDRYIWTPAKWTRYTTLYLKVERA